MNLVPNLVKISSKIFWPEENTKAKAHLLKHPVEYLMEMPSC